MTEKNVLIFQGGWDGHEPVKVAARFAKLMEKTATHARFTTIRRCFLIWIC